MGDGGESKTRNGVELWKYILLKERKVEMMKVKNVTKKVIVIMSLLIMVLCGTIVADSLANNLIMVEAADATKVTVKTQSQLDKALKNKKIKSIVIN